MIAACRACAVLGCVLLLATACSYRAAAPPTGDGSIALRVISTQTRLVQAQAHLHQQCSQALASRLGWQVRGDGSTLLALELLGEETSTSASDSRGVPLRLSDTLFVRCTWHGPAEAPPRQATFSARVQTSSLADEDSAVREACAELARQISDWCELGAPDTIVAPQAAQP